MRGLGSGVPGFPDLLNWDSPALTSSPGLKLSGFHLRDRTGPVAATMGKVPFILT